MPQSKGATPLRQEFSSMWFFVFWHQVELGHKTVDSQHSTLWFDESGARGVVSACDSRELQRCSGVDVAHAAFLFLRVFKEERL